MKKILLSVIALCGVYAQAQNVVFNDAALKQRIVLHDQNVVGGISGTGISLIDTDYNGEISIAEAQAYTGKLYLNQNGSNFYTDFTGVEEFINITELYCENNQMTTLNVSTLTELTGLYCENNQISSLNLTNNVNLEVLNYRYNNLPSVNLTSNVNLTNLTCTNNNIVNMDVSGNVNLEIINCSNNSIVSLDFANNTNLLAVNAFNNLLTSVNLLANVNLEELYIYDNLISTINLSNNVNLLYLTLSNNQLTQLDVLNNVNLSELNCGANQIVALDLSNNVILEEVYAYDNLITVLTLPNAVGYVNVMDNKLTSIDVSSNLNFFGINCANNELTYLNVASGGNTFFYEMIATGNPDLACITVDDVTYSTTNWTYIDATSSFSTNCPVLVNDITVTSQSNQYVILTDGATLQMEADILPVDATDATFVWSVINGTGAATIDASGLLTATNNGVVTVVATANDGSGITGLIDVEISGQTMASINTNSEVVIVNMFPNPTTGVVNIQSANQLETIEIYNLIGERVNIFTNTNTINISNLSKGVYMLKFNTLNGESITKKLIRE